MTKRTDDLAIVREYLADGERILWLGRPATDLRLRRGDRSTIPFSILWTAGVVAAVLAPAEKFEGSKLRLIPFGVAAAFLLVGRFYWDAFERARTLYGVTTRRTLVITTMFGSRATSYPLAEIGPMTVTRRADGSGDLVLADTDASFVASGGVVPKGSEVPPMLAHIADPQQVHDLIRHAQKG